MKYLLVGLISISNDPEGSLGAFRPAVPGTSSSGDGRTGIG